MARLATRCVGLLMVLLMLGLPPSALLLRADDPPAKATVAVDSRASSEPVPSAQWLDRIAEFFRLPIVNVALIAVGLVGVFFEFKFPGTTFPGSVAAICFVLFFWAYSFVGQFMLLAILLFLLGLVLLGVEVFLVPGLCFAGVAGAGLMFLALLLATLAHWPTDPNDWADVGATFGSIAIALALALGGALTLTWTLPNVPLLNRMVLQPPAESDAGVAALSLSQSGPVELLGAVGVAVTPLRPSGKAQFGDQFLDVIAEGEYIAPGGRLQVVEIEGSRIVVKEI